MHDKLTLRVSGSQTNVMQRGVELEPFALGYYRDRTGFNASPVCIQSRTTPWMRASLDGLDREAKRAVEIKCGESTYKHVARTRAVPHTAYIQMQHILAITGHEIMDFWCFFPDKRPIHIEICPNDYVIRKIEKAADDFWAMVGPMVDRKLAERHTSSASRP